jgi:hypothetical protein
MGLFRSGQQLYEVKAAPHRMTGGKINECVLTTFLYCGNVKDGKLIQHFKCPFWRGAIGGG